MKKFHFNLAAVESHRARLQDEAQSRLTKTIAAMRATQRKILAIDEDEIELRRRREKIGAGAEGEKPSLHTFWLIDQRIKALVLMRKEQQEQLKDDEVQVRSAYIDFLQARKQKKVMEKLHEKKLTEYKAARRKEEQKQNDELYTTRHQLEKLLGEGVDHE